MRLNLRSCEPAGMELWRALGWMARQEPCIGRHCQDWKKLHPYTVMTAHPRLYEFFGFHSPWVRALLTLQEWYNLYTITKNDLGSNGET